MIIEEYLEVDGEEFVKRRHRMKTSENREKCIKCGDDAGSGLEFVKKTKDGKNKMVFICFDCLIEEAEK